MMNATYTSPDGITQVVQGSTTAILASIYYQVIMDSVVWLLIALIFTIVDLYFGLEAASSRKEEIKVSNAIRRTLDKIFGYICWVVLSVSLAIGFHEEWIKYAIFAIIYGAELSSCFSNYFAAKGKTIHFNTFSIFARKLGIDELKEVEIKDNKNE